MAGEAALLLVRFGRRYAAAVRLATLAPICGIALFRAQGEQLAATAAVVAVAAAWTCGFSWWLRAGRGSWPVALDVLVLLGLYSSVPWTGAIEDTNTGWLRLLVTFACVTWQWHTTPAAGGAAAVAAGGGAALIVALAGGESLVREAMWATAAAALSRLAWVLVHHAAGRADRAAAEAVRARGASLVAEAVRAEERELANSLHDTAATTLLMVGTGQVRSDDGWLAPQARRDLDRLCSDAGRPPGGDDPEGPGGEDDLVERLRARLGEARLAVEFDAPERLRLPSDVARALADAAGEALTNVRRHAGTGRASVRLEGDARALRLDIADRGRGFAPAWVPLTRRGIRESLRGRMSRVGGTATITSAEGEGTLVSLEWPAPAGDADR
ncbi:ATP-binding protein [Nonomuraea sp. NPDC023979]|uniref:sensor histidine kinase n=1 Tax=Nonomuraea sp. NPDC023979 TaxID=3154796 RepID=UPI0033C11D07